MQQSQHFSVSYYDFSLQQLQPDHLRLLRLLRV